MISSGPVECEAGSLVASISELASGVTASALPLQMALGIGCCHGGGPFA